MLITQISSELAKSYYVKTTAYNSLNLIKFHNPFTIIKLRELEEKYNIKCISIKYLSNNITKYTFTFTP